MLTNRIFVEMSQRKRDELLFNCDVQSWRQKSNVLQQLDNMTTPVKAGSHGECNSQSNEIRESLNLKGVVYYKSQDMSQRNLTRLNSSANC